MWAWRWPPVSPAPGVAASRAPGAPAWGPDIQVNPVTTSTASVQRGFALAVDPTDSNRVIAGYDSWDPGLSYSGYSVSTDAGRTWAGARFYGPWISDTIPFGQPTSPSTGMARLIQQPVYRQQRRRQRLYGADQHDRAGLSAPNPVVVSNYARYHDQGRWRSTRAPAVPCRAALPVAALLRPELPNQGLRLRYSSDAGRTWSADVEWPIRPNPTARGRAWWLRTTARST